jgi:cytochrome c-type biogenesis protein CcmH/NrfF
MRAALCVCALLLALTAFPARAAADQAADDARTRWAYDLANDLMSPFCPGRSLADCPSPDAASLRLWIVVQAAAGRTRADVEQELYTRYGEVIRAKPKVEGFGTAAYLIPIGAFVAGGGLVVWFLQRATKRGRSRPAEPVRGLDPETERKLDELLDGGDASGAETR